MTYTSLHHYLDVHLSENASDTDIKQAKADYWKWYRTEHRRQRREEAKSLHLTISLVLWESLNSLAKASGISVYDFVKDLLEDAVQKKPRVEIQVSVAVFSCYELLKDYTENETTIESVLDAMEHVISLL